MNSPKHSLFALLVAVLLSGVLAAQQPAAQSVTVVPRLVNYSGKATDARGSVVSGIAGVTFAIYKDEYEGSPLWIETQNVQADARGNYTVQLGATKPAGLPMELFTSGEARWLGVRVNGGDEQPRVLLLSVPYALKAADAETLGGLPLSAFVLATPAIGGVTTASASAGTSAAPPVNPTVTGAGTVGQIPLWDSTSDITSSVITQTGSGSTARVGINSPTPAATLDVKGTSNFRGIVTMPSAGLATATTGKDSYPFVFAASAFNSSSKASVLENFRWQAEPVNNNSTSPAGSLNLLFSAGTGTPAETGLSIASNGQITFAPGQTFPGGSGTITGVTAGADLTGGGTTGVVTLNLDTTKVPLLKAANTFTGNQTINGNISATGVVAGSSYQIGSNLFAFGSYTSGNSFLGFSGNSTTTGTYNTASGLIGLTVNTTGSFNTAMGALSLVSNSTGSYNSSNGVETLHANTTGSFNTANGSLALNSNTIGNYNTASGLNALFSNVSGNNNTATGASALYLNTGSDNTANGYEALFYNTTGQLNTATGFEALQQNQGSYNTADGAYALFANGAGLSNTAYGYQGLYSNTTGSGNTASGLQSLSSNQAGNYNTASGYQSLFKNNTDYNTAMGYQTLYSNTTGAYNTAVGSTALYLNTLGSDNIAVGGGALFSNVTGTGSTAVGYLALQNNDANFNTALGHHALQANTTGYSNTGTGVQALLSNTVGDDNTANGLGALNYNTSGSNNTAVGAAALYENTTGSNNTCIGYQCDFYGPDLNNSTAIGAHASVSISDALVLGSVAGVNGATSTTHIGIGTNAPSAILTIGRGLGHPVSDSWETYSSRRWKTNIQTLPNALAKVEQLRGVTYDLKDSGKHEIGVIAEEVGAVVPELVTYEENGKDARGVDYSRLTALLIEAAKQQQREIRALKSELRQTRQSLQQVKAQLAASGSTLVAKK